MNEKESKTTAKMNNQTCNDIAAVTKTHNLTTEQSQALHSMLQQINHTQVSLWTTEHETSSFLCHRFLRARCFNVEKALLMLHNDLIWREEYGIKKLQQQTLSDFATADFNPEELLVRLPILLEGTDNLCRPVIYKAFGAACEISTLLTMTDQETLIRYHIWCNEQSILELNRLSTVHSRNIETWQIVIDAMGWHLGLANSSSMSFLKSIAKIDSDHYPERLGRLTVVNAPWTLSGVWRVIRLWLDERQKRKIEIMSWQSSWEPYLKGEKWVAGQDSDGEQVVVYEQGGIPTENLIRRFGGSNEKDFGLMNGGGGGGEEDHKKVEVEEAETKVQVEEAETKVEEEVVMHVKVDQVKKIKMTVHIEDVKCDDDGCKTLSV